MANYTGVNGSPPFPNLIPGPDAGQPVTAASVGIVAQAAANQDKRLYDFLAGEVYTAPVLFFNGRFIPLRPRIDQSAADHTINVTQGHRFRLADTASTKVITLDHTIAPPEEGETLDFLAPSLTGSGLTNWSFRRSGGVIVAEFVTPSVASSGGAFWAQFEWTGSVWRLGANSGAAYDGGTPDVYGVIPGAGA